MFLIFMVYNHLYYHLSKVTKLQAHYQNKCHDVKTSATTHPPNAVE